MVSYAGRSKGWSPRPPARSWPRAMASARWPTRWQARGCACWAADGDRLTFHSNGDDDLRTFWRLVGAQGLEVRHLGALALTLEDAVVRMMEHEHA